MVIFGLSVSMHLVAGAAMSFVPLYLVDKHGIASVFTVIALASVVLSILTLLLARKA